MMTGVEFLGVNWGTPFQALSAFFTGGIFAAILTFLVRWRALSIGAEQVLRTHFGDELARLTRQVHDCEDDKKQLWLEIEGLRREMAQNSQSTAQLIGNLQGGGNGG